MEFGNAKRLQYLIDSDPELKRLARESRAEARASEGLAACGVAYPLGEGAVRPPGKRALVALEAIDSPLLGRIEDAAPIDAYRALYVVCEGPAALSPVLACDVRRAALDKLKELASGSPEALAVYLSRVDAVTKETWQEFDLAALAYTEKHFGHVDPVDVLNVIASALRDAVAGFAQGAPAPDGDEAQAEKKTASGNGTTPTGAGTTTCSVIRWAWTRKLLRWPAWALAWLLAGGRKARAAEGTTVPRSSG
jgi:hypothetical protein